MKTELKLYIKDAGGMASAAKRLGVTVSTLYNWRKGRLPPFYTSYKAIMRHAAAKERASRRVVI